MNEQEIRTRLSVLVVMACLLAACVPKEKYGAAFSILHELKPNTSAIGKGEFRLMYQGLYGFQVVTTERPPNPIDPEAFSLSVSYEIRSDEQLIRSGVLTDLTSPWWGREGDAGFILEWLHVPEELPMGSKLSVSYSAVADQRFISCFGSGAAIGIWKLSDK